MPDPVDVGAQSDLFGATAPAVARPPITEQNESLFVSRISIGLFRGV
jgi:hypothetical protein